MKGLFGAHGSLTFNDTQATLGAVGDPSAATGSTAYLFIYPLFVITACFHLANGFWTAGITWGLTIEHTGSEAPGGSALCRYLPSRRCGFLALIAVWTHAV